MDIARDTPASYISAFVIIRPAAEGDADEERSGTGSSLEGGGSATNG